jgi:hypothetical protein
MAARKSGRGFKQGGFNFPKDRRTPKPKPQRGETPDGDDRFTFIPAHRAIVDLAAKGYQTLAKNHKRQAKQLNIDTMGVDTVMSRIGLVIDELTRTNPNGQVQLAPPLRQALGDALSYDLRGIMRLRKQHEKKLIANHDIVERERIVKAIAKKIGEQLVLEIEGEEEHDEDEGDEGGEPTDFRKLAAGDKDDDEDDTL